MQEFIQIEKSSKQYKTKSVGLQHRINEALYILYKFGVSLNSANFTPRRLERIALVFIAVAGVTDTSDWSEAKDYKDSYYSTTRDLIKYINEHFGENVSSGSYDDVRRKDLKPLVQRRIVVPTKEAAASNDPKRAYALNPEYSIYVRSFGSTNWDIRVEQFMSEGLGLANKLSQPQSIEKVGIVLPSGLKLELSSGEHNKLQKAVIEELLPRYGYNAEILYIGDTSNKTLYVNEEQLAELGLTIDVHQKLPDIVAYSSGKGWLYIIEAVYSSGPISTNRLLELKEFMQACKAEVIYITTFLDRKTFRSFVNDIAWETEVWLANEPDHLIHFNGEKFLGPIHPNE